MRELIHKLRDVLGHLERPHKFKQKIRKLIQETNLNLGDFRYNTWPIRRAPHILFLREYCGGEDYNKHFLHWIKTRHPALSKHFRLVRLGDALPRLEHTALYVPWLHNFKKDVFSKKHKQAQKIEELGSAKGIPVINNLASLESIFKSNALRIIASTGIRTARAVLINKKDMGTFDPKRLGLPYPFFIREDYFHHGEVYLVKNEEQLPDIPWEKFDCPVAIEFIDVKDKDGLYRKYRYVMAGDEGVPRHLVVSENWYVHVKDQILESKYHEEEMQYLKLPKDPNHDRLNAARKALGLDIVTFDYSYTPDGKLVVWEPNSAADYWTQKNESIYSPHQRESVERIYRMFIDYYLRRAGIK